MHLPKQTPCVMRSAPPGIGAKHRGILPDEISPAELAAMVAGATPAETAQITGYVGAYNAAIGNNDLAGARQQLQNLGFHGMLGGGPVINPIVARERQYVNDRQLAIAMQMNEWLGVGAPAPGGGIGGIIGGYL